MGFNVATMLREAARADASKTFLHAEEGSLTYDELERNSAELAAGLRRHGLETGDRVVMQMPNGLPFVETYLAVLRAGMVAVPVNPLLKKAELGHVLDDSGARLLIADVDSAATASAAADARPGVRVLVGIEELRGEEGSADLADTRPHDTAVLIYTSGTTGRPKGAELTHFQLYIGCTVTSEVGEVSDQDVMFTALPLFHVFGLASVLHTVVRRGASLVLVRRFRAEEVVGLLRRHRATVLYAVPTMYVGLLEALRDQPPLDSLRLAYSGGAPIPEEVMRAFEAAAGGAAVLEGYGLSESGATVTFNFSPEERRFLSVGKPIWGVEVRIVDERDEPLPRGRDAVGEIVVQGHVVMKGYFGNPEATAEALRGGWLHTGDLGYLDEDGYLFIVGRKKEMIIRGGYNVYPREIEEVLYAHPAVLEAAVVGEPDPRLGEEVRAYVGLRAGQTVETEELIEYCRDRLAAYKYPRQIEILEELPKGPTGKILKRELKALAV